ncbi:MAG: Glu-tRNA(Gln) amidotransferase subunit GatE [Candidatus Thorarchaeota archaeon]
MSDEGRLRKIGLMVGLELHQQLNTSRKLFCHCPTVIRDDKPDGGFVRRLRPTQSEMGAVDPAALFEFQRKKKFYYEYYNDTTCLVEADEEPPHNLCEESIDVALTMATFLGSSPLDEIHAMRKIVIDGSNTTGFQRTAVIAMGGKILVGTQEIGIQAISLEEDAARKIADDDKENMKIYRLDRLGIPLIEVATAPDIRTPSEAQETALAIGLLLRSTGKVKRGLGTIRQDVNVSIKGGAIIEIKGFQQLDMLSTLVELEALRQERLLEIRDALHERNISPKQISSEPVDVSAIFAKSGSKMIKKALKTGHTIYGVRLPGFAGLVGRELQPERRLGTELSDYAKFWGDVGGIFHTDELPGYGISAQEVAQLREAVSAGSQDAVVIVAAPLRNCVDALEAVVRRAREAIEGVPTETRTPLPNGTTKYARPRPGAERMYPETDVRPVKITQPRLKRTRKNMPETFDNKEKRFVKEYGLSKDLAFEQIMREMKVPATLLAVTLENTVVSLHRDGVPIERLEDNHFRQLFECITRTEVSPDAIPVILTYLANNPTSGIQDALDATDLGKIDTTEVENLVRKIVGDRIDFVREQGERALGGLMGVAMKQLRGKADGKVIKKLLAAEIQRVLASAEE